MTAFKFVKQLPILDLASFAVGDYFVLLQNIKNPEFRVYQRLKCPTILDDGNLVYRKYKTTVKTDEPINQKSNPDVYIRAKVLFDSTGYMWTISEHTYNLSHYIEFFRAITPAELTELLLLS